MICRCAKNRIPATVSCLCLVAVVLSNVGKGGCRYVIKSETIHYRLESGHYSDYVQKTVLGIHGFHPLWDNKFTAREEIGDCYNYPEDYKELQDDYFQKKATWTRIATTSLGCAVTLLSILSLVLNVNRLFFPIIGVFSLIVCGLDAQALDFLDSSMCNRVWSLSLTTEEIPSNQATPPYSSCTSLHWGAWLNVTSVILWIVAGIICIFGIFFVKDEATSFHRHSNYDEDLKDRNYGIMSQKNSECNQNIDSEYLSDEEYVDEPLPVKTVLTDKTISIGFDDDDSTVSAGLDNSKGKINDQSTDDLNPEKSISIDNKESIVQSADVRDFGGMDQSVDF